jgi:hypothetical protein
MTRAAVFSCVAAALAFTFVGLAAAPHAQGPPEGWSTFEGNWSATGRRQTLPTEGDGRAAVIQLSGAVVLTNRAGLGRGFRGEAIGFDDGRSISMGRAVWTDAHGDLVFSVLKGDPIGRGRRILGTFTGGTGRYAGLIGDYELTWQYVVYSEGDVVQGRAVDLKGRFRRRDAQR